MTKPAQTVATTTIESKKMTLVANASEQPDLLFRMVDQAPIGMYVVDGDFLLQQVNCHAAQCSQLCRISAVILPKSLPICGAGNWQQYSQGLSSYVGDRREVHFSSFL